MVFQFLNNIFNKNYFFFVLTAQILSDSLVLFVFILKLIIYAPDLTQIQMQAEHGKILVNLPHLHQSKTKKRKEQNEP